MLCRIRLFIPVCSLPLLSPASPSIPHYVIECVHVRVCMCVLLSGNQKKKSLKHTSALPTQNNLTADVLQRSASWSSQFHCFERKKERVVPNKRKNCYARQNQHNCFNIVNFWSSCSLIIIDSQQFSKVAHSVEP